MLLRGSVRLWQGKHIAVLEEQECVQLFSQAPGRRPKKATIPSLGHGGDYAEVCDARSSNHVETTQRNSRPSQSHGPRGAWETITAKHQRSKHHCTKVSSFVEPQSKRSEGKKKWFSHENSMSHNWPPETMMSGKFIAQKIVFDHPSVSLGDQFAPLLVGMPVTRNSSPKIPCRGNLRCKTKSSSQRSFSPWSNVHTTWQQNGAGRRKSERA